MFIRTPTLCGILAISALFACRVNAQMTLTPTAVTAGFSLSTFATGFPSDGGVGPVGITFTPSGGVLVSNYGSGNLYRFATDTDGQTLAMASNSTFYGGRNLAGLATTGGKYYMVQQQSGQVIQVNENTTFNHVVISGLNSPLGLVTNPANGHLLASVNGSGKIIDVNPATGVAADVITGLPDVDGISISADGSVVFAAVRGNGQIGRAHV